MRGRQKWILSRAQLSVHCGQVGGLNRTLSPENLTARATTQGQPDGATFQVYSPYATTLATRGLDITPPPSTTSSHCTSSLCFFSVNILIG